MHSNIVIKTLQQYCETRLYINTQFSIGKNWQDLANLTNFYQNNVMEKNAFNNKCLIYIVPTNLKKYYMNIMLTHVTLMQNILKSKHIVNDDNKILILPQGQGFQGGCKRGQVGKKKLPISLQFWGVHEINFNVNLNHGIS